LRGRRFPPRIDHDIRARQAAMYRASSGTGAAPAPSFYPRVNSAAAASLPDRGASFHHPASSAPPPSSSAAGLGIKVMIKPEYQITPASTGDPIADKYVASGLGREAVSLAVLNYGDNPVKVREFVKGYNILREMGFSSKNVAEALAIYDNDTDKAVAHFLNTTQ
ncbi:hypothetical protein B296_00040406, partial [Ensete ventricosum]